MKHRFSKDNPVHGLEKIPDNALIKELRLELGKTNSYIQEIEHNAKKREKEILVELKRAKKEVSHYRSRRRIGFGNSLEFEQWITDNNIDPEQAQKLRDLIRFG